MRPKAGYDVALADANDASRIAFVSNDVHSGLGRNCRQIEQLEVAVMTVVAALHPSY